MEPFEALTVDVEEQHQGSVMEALGPRRGDLTNMESDSRGRARLEYRIPARGLLARPAHVVHFFRDVHGIYPIAKEVLAKRTNEYR